ncbi:hypothetical protein Q9L58_003513 [Maublancomyces gigas]|uniref:Uncharacterized protein n=1 Tax=Discina gigas TaxID=1032678 RepID=A0ABR3GNK7_9PEZI
MTVDSIKHGTTLCPFPHQEDLISISALRENIQKELLDKKSPPSETEVLSALQACQSYVAFQLEAASNISADTTPTSALLSLDDDRIKQATQHPSSSSVPSSLPRKKVPGLPIARPPAECLETVAASLEKTFPSNFDPLTDIAYKIVSHPSVFLTTKILASYVSLQSLICDPSPIPAVFSLYANKPFTPPGSSKTLYPNPRQAKHAIPSSIASAALGAAIGVKDMSLCLDIIDTSYGAPAFQRSKLIRRATPAAVACCLVPAAVYTLADMLAKYQDEVDHSLAVKYAFVGMLAYVFFTGSIGMVALMTSNDQMVRVTWIVGTPLRQRWWREEEREALDRVAQAWGFEEPNKRGFEEGDEWELLREVANRKGMYLDNPTLMEGME